MQKKNETHQQPRAHKTYTRLIVMILVYLVILACVVAIMRYWSSQEVIGGLGEFGTEQITFTSYQWASGDTSITITVKNTGLANLTIVGVLVNKSSVSYSVNAIGGQLAKGSSAKIVIQSSSVTGRFVSGTQYGFYVAIANTYGNDIFGPYTLTAPSF